MSYKILRFFQNEKHPTQVLATGLTFEEVREHCKDPETGSRTCEAAEAPRVSHARKSMGLGLMGTTRSDG